MWRIPVAIVLAVATAAPMLLYDFAVTTNAGLCGRTGWPEILAAAIAFAVVASWGARAWRARLLFALPSAVFAANACALLAAYADTPAHGYCETLTPYVLTV